MKKLSVPVLKSNLIGTIVFPIFFYLRDGLE